jgi:hypothetical protein
MLDVIREPRPVPVTLLDVDFGASHLLEYLLARGLEGIDYCGLDISREFVELTRRKSGSLSLT